MVEDPCKQKQLTLEFISFVSHTLLKNLSQQCLPVIQVALCASFVDVTMEDNRLSSTADYKWGKSPVIIF